MSKPNQLYLVTREPKRGKRDTYTVLQCFVSATSRVGATKEAAALWPFDFGGEDNWTLGNYRRPVAALVLQGPLYQDGQS